MIAQSFNQPVEILIIEDNPGAVRLIVEAFKDVASSKKINSVGNGVEAMAYLNREGEFKQALRPDIIILDLNLPKKNGFEVLAEIKGNAAFRRIPVIVLTSSRKEEDVQKSYDLQANCYLVKPVDLVRFNQLVRSMEDFWFNSVRLPT